jgi:Putative beta-barrel porin-2, OmpL-like. bbp2
MSSRNPEASIARTPVFVLCLALSCSLRAQTPPDLNQQVAELRALVERLQGRVAELEARLNPATSTPAPAPAPPTPIPPPTALAGTTINFLVDGYYDYNFNAPIGRANRLRAYDVTSNNFSINQAAVVLENAPDLEKGKRWGARLDLQWGQATQTLQGNTANEARPDLYRNLFQAYGTFIAPLGKGLKVDFGKWASSLGIEGNYTQDQMNYSRSYWFTFLPFYHMGVRTNYQFSDKFGINYWITNGTQQTEAFNGFKDQLGGVVLQPHKNINWTVNYYFGQEHPDTIFYLYAPAPIPNPPTQQGTPFVPIEGAPTGRLHIFDTYATWNATSALTFALEGDYVIQRLYKTSPPQHAAGGAAYAQYQFTPKFALAGRAEYLSDRGALFSGVSQALKETTFTTTYRFAERFMARTEWRYDFSNQPYFYTSTLGVTKKSQLTATLGLIWWYGGKTGAW